MNAIMLVADHAPEALACPGDSHEHDLSYWASLSEGYQIDTSHFGMEAVPLYRLEPRRGK